MVEKLVKKKDEKRGDKDTKNEISQNATNEINKMNRFSCKVLKDSMMKSFVLVTFLNYVVIYAIVYLKTLPSQ